MTGWTEMRVTRGLDQCASEFELATTARGPASTAQRWVKPFERCELRLGGSLLLTGHVDRIEPRLTAKDLGAAVSGRSLTADLVDCPPGTRGGQFRGSTFAAIARAVAAPFGVEVVDEVPDGRPVAIGTIEEGETAFEFLERLARQRGALLTDDPSGRLVVSLPAPRRAAVELREGANILAVSASFDVSKRFSEYRTKGQDGVASARTAAPALVPVNGEARPGGGARPSQAALVRDAAVPRFRPRTVNAEGGEGAASPADRARAEMAKAIAKSLVIKVTVKGYHQAPGRLWAINEEVGLRVPTLDLSGDDFIVTEVTYGLDPKAGATTVVQLGLPEGYARPIASPGAAARGRSAPVRGLTPVSEAEQRRND